MLIKFTTLLPIQEYPFIRLLLLDESSVIIPLESKYFPCRLAPIAESSKEDKKPADMTIKIRSLSDVK